MKFSIELTINNTEGALERVLGRLRQRNFALITLTAGRSADASILDARMVIEGTRSIEPVMKQLGKLYDVRHVQVRTMEGSVAYVYAQTDAASRLGLCASL